MGDEQYSSLLAYYNSSSGVIPIVNRLPYSLQERWTSQAANYKAKHHVAFPPFKIFAEYLRTISQIRNDPSFAYENMDTGSQKVHNKPIPRLQRTTVSARKTETMPGFPSKRPEINLGTHCPMHTTKHTLNHCYGFRAKPLDERKELIKSFGMCFKCCASNKHQARTCSEAQSCSECGSSRHPTALHVGTSTSNPTVTLQRL